MLIVLRVELDLQAVFAGSGIDLIHSDLHAGFHSGTVNSSAAGQGAGHTDLNGVGVCGFLGTAACEHSSDHNHCQYKCEKLFHFHFSFSYWELPQI